MTKFVVISKILVLAFDNCSYHWADYIEKYIHTEHEILETMNIEILEIKGESKTFFEYDNANVFNMATHQIGYIILAPIMGMY